MEDITQQLARRVADAYNAKLDAALSQALSDYEPTMDFTIHCYSWPSEWRADQTTNQVSVVVNHAFRVVDGGGCQIINHPYGEEPPRD